MRTSRAISIGIVLGALGLGAGLASAQEHAYSASFDPEQFAGSADPDQISLLDGARTQARGALGVGAVFHLSGAQLGLCVRDTASSDPSCDVEGDILSSRLRADLGVLYGLGRLDVRFTLPLVLYQATDFSPPSGSEPLNAAGVGNPHIGVRVQLARPGPIAIAADLAGTIPTGAYSFIGDQGLIIEPRLLADLRRGKLAAGLNVGYRFRQESARMADLYVDDELTWSAAVEYWLAPRKLALGAAAYGRVGFMEAPADLMEEMGVVGAEERPAEVMGSLRYVVSDRVAVDVGGGAGLTAGYGAAPFRVLAGVRWSDRKEVRGPAVVVRIADRDKDGVGDRDDQCPKEAEDLDGFEDVDGCPDDDNDGDQVADADDRCALVAEDKDGFDDRDGCPDEDDDKDGVADANDRCPSRAEDLDGLEDDDGCPDHDVDRDSIPDTADRCPSDMEDVDGFHDDDGCPEDDDHVAVRPTPVPQKPTVVPPADADGDGLADAVDRCPDQAEVFNGSDDDDGCPDAGKTLAVVEGDAVVITEKIFFETDRARIRTRSHPVLDAVAAILRAHSDLRIRIEGHTDDQGVADWNRKLSGMRADRVREYLIKKGIAADRLLSQGFGSDRPLVEGSTEAARDKNRRVEFVIIGRTQ